MTRENIVEQWLYFRKQMVLHRFLDNDDIIRLTLRLDFMLRDNVLMSLSKRLPLGFFRVIGGYSKYSNYTFTTDNP